jgi:hypothetical protein
MCDDAVLGALTTLSTSAASGISANALAEVRGPASCVNLA